MCRSVGNNLGNTLRRQVGSIAEWDKVWRWRGWKWCGGVVASPARGIQIGRRGCACIYEIAVPRSFRGSHSGPEIRRRRCRIRVIRAAPVTGTWRRGTRKDWRRRNEEKTPVPGGFWSTCYPVVGGDPKEGVAYGAGAWGWGQRDWLYG